MSAYSTAYIVAQLTYNDNLVGPKRLELKKVNSNLSKLVGDVIKTVSTDLGKRRSGWWYILNCFDNTLIPTDAASAAGGSPNAAGAGSSSDSRPDAYAPFDPNTWADGLINDATR